MKYLNKIVMISIMIILILSGGGCSNNNLEVYKNEELSVERNEGTPIDVKLGNKFTISFWVKPETNYYGSTILSFDDTKQTFNLITNSMDENYYSTGITLYGDNGMIYKDGNSYLDTQTYNYVVIRYKDNNFYLSLNGENIGNEVLTKNLKTRKLTINFGGELFKGTFKDINMTNNFLDDDEIMNNYNQNLLYRLDNIDFDETFKNNAYGKISVPNSRYNVSYYSDSDLLTIEDQYLNFEKNNDDKDKKVNLIASTNINGINIEKTITFTIKGDNDQNTLESVSQKVKNNLTYIISESNIFDSEIDGCEVKYEVTSGLAYFDEESRKFIKYEEAEKTEEINIKATISLNGLSKEVEKKVKIIDEYYGYLLAYFSGYDGNPDYLTGDETLYFALSRDGVNWNKLNDKELISTKEGSGRFRDPYVQRNKDNEFVIVCTEGYKNQGMYVIDTDDFTSFDVKHIMFASNDRSIGLDGKYVWAPEFFYDEEKDLYTITYSDPGDNCKGIYAVDTEDFVNFSAPYLFFTLNKNVIDCNVALIDGDYYLFYKDEDKKTIHYAMSKDLNSRAWDLKNSGAIKSPYNLEGPELFNNHITNKITLYADAYEDGYIVSSDVQNTNNQLLINEKVDFSLTNLKGVRHFSIIELTKDEYERIADYYGQ